MAGPSLRLRSAAASSVRWELRMRAGRCARPDASDGRQREPLARLVEPKLAVGEPRALLEGEEVADGSAQVGFTDSWLCLLIALSGAGPHLAQCFRA